MKTSFLLLVLLIAITLITFIAISSLPELPNVSFAYRDCAAYADLGIDYLKAHPRLTCQQAIWLVNGGQ